MLFKHFSCTVFIAVVYLRAAAAAAALIYAGLACHTLHYEVGVGVGICVVLADR